MKAFVACVIGLTALGPLRAAEKPSSVPSTFRSYVVVDERYPKLVAKDKSEQRDPRDRTEKMHCFVTEQSLNPTVMVFTRLSPNADSPVGKIAKKLDESIMANKAYKIGASIQFLTLEKEFHEDERAVENNPTKGLLRELETSAIRTAAASYKTTNILYGLAAGDSKQVTEWGIDKQDEIVVVLYNRMKITRRWKFDTKQVPTESDLKAIADAFGNEAVRKADDNRP